jgi:hypothetical protein
LFLSFCWCFSWKAFNQLRHCCPYKYLQSHVKNSCPRQSFWCGVLIGNPLMANVTCQRSRKEKDRLGIEILMTCCPMTPLRCCLPLRPQAHAETKSQVQEDRNKGTFSAEVHVQLPNYLHPWLQFYLNSGVAGFSDARSEQWQWTPLTEITITDWINVLFVVIIWNMLSAENRFLFYLRHSFCRRLDSAARGGSIFCPILATPLYLNTGYTKPTINEKLVRQLFTDPRRIIVHDPETKFFITLLVFRFQPIYNSCNYQIFR